MEQLFICNNSSQACVIFQLHLVQFIHLQIYYNEVHIVHHVISERYLPLNKGRGFSVPHFCMKLIKPLMYVTYFIAPPAKGQRKYFIVLWRPEKINMYEHIGRLATGVERTVPSGNLCACTYLGANGKNTEFFMLILNSNHKR